MKARLDTPHLTPLRYDYALLHESYSLQRPISSAIASVLVLAGLAGLLIDGLLWGLIAWGVL